MLRFAPSPTGDMHIANLRVAILNYLVAQQKDEPFLVRIEDTNTQRNIEGKDTEIMMLLEKFALKHNSVFHQSEHLNLYQTLALRLLKEKKAFVCKCSDEKLEENNEQYRYSGRCQELAPEEYTALKNSGETFVIRVKKPDADIKVNDLIKGSTTATADEIDSFVILKTDGLPSYDFACACDDMLSNISFIIRGEEYLKNTPKQIHIKNLLGYENDTLHAHLPTILNTNNSEASSVKWLFEQGYVPDAILNYLLLVGNTKLPKEVFTLPEAIEWFNLEEISTTAVEFDLEKLRFINREHLKMMDDKQLSTLFGFADTDIGKLAKLYLEECSTISELEAKIRPIFKAKDFTGEWGEEMSMLSRIIFDAPFFQTFDQLEKHIIKESGLTQEKLSTPLRYLLTATGNGPKLSDIYPFIKSYILEVAS